MISMMVLTDFTAHLQTPETSPLLDLQHERSEAQAAQFNAGEAASGMCLNLRGDSVLLVGAKNTVGFVISWISKEHCDLYQPIL